MPPDEEIASIEEAIDELLDRLQAAIASGQTINNEILLAASEEISLANARIEELQAQGAVPQGPIEASIPQGVELLWILSGSQPNAFVSYLRTFPGPGYQELANNPERLAQVIEQLSRSNPGQEPQVGPDGIPDTQLASSNVSGMRYDPTTRKLLVKFHGNDGEPIYQYDQVPPQIFQLLEHGNAFARTRGRNRFGQWWPMKNPSIGAAVNQYLKQGGYNYQRIA